MTNVSSDPLLELLASRLTQTSSFPNYNSNCTSSARKALGDNDNGYGHDDILTNPISTAYLSRLSSLTLSSIFETEHVALQSSAHTLNISIQSLCSRSHKSLIASSGELDKLQGNLDKIREDVDKLCDKRKEKEGGRTQKPSTPSSSPLTELGRSIENFTTKFSRDSFALSERQKASLLSRNLDRLLDILELPTLLKSCISSGNYPSALDILGHVRRLGVLYPASSTIHMVAGECAGLQKSMVTNLVNALKGPVKLPSAMKMVGWLKRVVPEMGEDEDLARALFLVCRLAWVEGLFGALDPLRELADEEGEVRRKGVAGGTGSGQSSRSGTPGPGGERDRRKGRTLGVGLGSGTGQHTERYLKRWIEIFREQSFAVISMYRSIFPDTGLGGKNASKIMALPRSLQSSMRQQENDGERNEGDSDNGDDDVEKGSPPSPLSTFTLHLLGLLENTLGIYLPNIQDKSARESLLTQVLYAAGSLGRLGGDFSGLVACLSDIEVTGGSQEGEEGERNEEVEEWVEVMKKHKVLASRLDALAAGGSIGNTTGLGSSKNTLGT